jgi:acetylornithine deacetylase/succinyl-diaminopimelate desuccinylase-like protein
MPSVCGDFAEANKIIDYAAEYLQTCGMHVVRHESHGFPSLVATTRKTKAPKVMLAGHLDVVPAPEELFTLRLKDGRYYGRGVFDMKFAVASYLHLVDELQHELAQYDFGIMLTTDEEQYGPYGTGMLIEKGYVPEVCVLPDASSDWNIETFAKGRWFVRLNVNGRSAHGSRPWEGDSATVRLVELLHEIHALFADGQQPDSHTLNVGVVQGGAMVNQIPDRATAELDIRYTTTEFMAEIEVAIRQLCRKYGVTFTELSDNAEPVTNELTNPYIAAFAECITEETGIIPEAIRSFAASDARFFMRANVPCVVTSPRGGNRHSDDEWCDVASYNQMQPILRRYLQRMAQTQ